MSLARLKVAGGGAPSRYGPVIRMPQRPLVMQLMSPSPRQTNEYIAAPAHAVMNQTTIQTVLFCNATIAATFYFDDFIAANTYK